MVRLAEFLAIPCQPLALEEASKHAEFLNSAVPDDCSCFVVNPEVIKDWIGGDEMPADLVAFLRSRFSHLIVYGLRTDAFHNKVVSALSQGRLSSVESISPDDNEYSIPGDASEFCEAFSGLTFGPADIANDHVFGTNDSDSAVRQLILIGGRPFMAAVRLEGAELLFVAGEDVADLNTEVGGTSLVEYFSRFVPHVMALRRAAGDECWRSSEAHASIIIDDPLLRKSYGYLNFDSLLRLANQYNFHSAIAFIPHNFRRSSPRIARMFREHDARLSICFHGNDHTNAEFASNDVFLLDTLVRVAEERMKRHRQITGVSCEKIMVFPQGNFSMEAMRVLKSRNFQASINTVPHPKKSPVRLTIGELAQPAVMRYEGFPLFIRRPIKLIQSFDIAFNLFFGIPVFFVEHHEIFKNPEPLVKVAEATNSLAPWISWCDPATAVREAFLTRKGPDGAYYVRAYSRTIRISNESPFARRYAIEWEGNRDVEAIQDVLVDGSPYSGLEIDGERVRIWVELAAGTSHTCSLAYRNVQAANGKLGFRWNIAAFVRRRLSEFRDNYLSKNAHILSAAKTFQRRYLRV